jgi:[acyl-carrier-protein] S-malonyltransferase
LLTADVCLLQAVFIAGLAAVERLRSEHSLAALAEATACAGLDVGEFAAMVFAGVMGFEDALRLVQARVQP